MGSSPRLKTQTCYRISSVWGKREEGDEKERNRDQENHPKTYLETRSLTKNRELKSLRNWGEKTMKRREKFITFLDRELREFMSYGG